MKQNTAGNLWRTRVTNKTLNTAFHMPRHITRLVANYQSSQIYDQVPHASPLGPYDACPPGSDVSKGRRHPSSHTRHKQRHTNTHAHTQTRTDTKHRYTQTHRHTHRHTDTQTHRRTDTQTRRRTDKKTRHTYTHA